MPIKRLLTAEVETYLDDVQFEQPTSLDADTYVEASAYAEDVLFGQNATTEQAVEAVAARFLMTRRAATEVVTEVIAANGGEEGGLYSPLIQAQTKRSRLIREDELRQWATGNLTYINPQIQDPTRITAALCEPFQARSLVVIAMDHGPEVYLSSFDGEDAAQQVVSYIASTVHAAAGGDVLEAELHDRVSEIIEVLPDDIVEGDEFSPHLERGMREGSLDVRRAGVNVGDWIMLDHSMGLNAFVEGFDPEMGSGAEFETNWQEAVGQQGEVKRVADTAGYGEMALVDFGSVTFWVQTAGLMDEDAWNEKFSDDSDVEASVVLSHKGEAVYEGVQAVGYRIENRTQFPF